VRIIDIDASGFELVPKLLWEHMVRLGIGTWNASGKIRWIIAEVACRVSVAR
jgi:hypothetical protein